MFHLHLVTIGLLVGSFSANAAEIIINQKNKKFNPAAVTAKLGDTLVFKNEEADVTHNVYSMTPDNNVESQMQKPSEILKVVLDPAKHKPGVMEIKCAVHPDMKLKVTINK